MQDVPDNPVQPGPPTAGGHFDPTDDVSWVDDWNHQPDPVVVEEPPSVSVFEQDLDGYGLYEEAADEGFDPGLDGTF